MRLATDPLVRNEKRRCLVCSKPIKAYAIPAIDGGGVRFECQCTEKKVVKAWKIADEAFYKNPERHAVGPKSRFG